MDSDAFGSMRVTNAIHTSLIFRESDRDDAAGFDELKSLLRSEGGMLKSSCMSFPS